MIGFGQCTTAEFLVNTIKEEFQKMKVGMRQSEVAEQWWGDVMVRGHSRLRKLPNTRTSGNMRRLSAAKINAELFPKTRNSKSSNSNSGTFLNPVLNNPSRNLSTLRAGTPTMAVQGPPPQDQQGRPES